MRIGIELLFAISILVLAFGWKQIPVLMKGVKKGLDDLGNGLGGGGHPRY